MIATSKSAILATFITTVAAVVAKSLTSDTSLISTAFITTMTVVPTMTFVPTMAFVSTVASSTPRLGVNLQTHLAKQLQYRLINIDKTQENIGSYITIVPRAPQYVIHNAMFSKILISHSLSRMNC